MSLFATSAIAAGIRTQVTNNIFSVPLTYDEMDGNDSVSLTRQGTAPWITPIGMVGDGYEARYRVEAEDLPGWLKTGSTGPLTLQASVKGESWRNSTRDVVVSACEDDGAANPKLELAITEDIEYTDTADVILRTYDGSMRTLRLNRLEWSYFRRFPELQLDGYNARPQGFCFIDSDTFLVTAHFENQFSICYKVRVSDGAILGSFKIGPEVGVSAAHIGSITRRSDGEYWFSENSSRILYEVDLDASFADGNMVSTASYDVTATVSASAIAFATIDGTEYLLIGEYRTTGTPYLYVLPASLVTDGGTLDLADREKRFEIEQRCQGVYYKNNQLYVSSNRFTADSGTAPGRFYVVDIDTALASASDGSTLSYLYHWSAPSQYPEDIDFHPVTGEVWTTTEGLTSVGSDNGFMGIWHRSLTEEKAADYPVNHYTMEYDGAGTVTVKVNGQLFDEMSAEPTVTPSVLSIGGPPTAGAGQTNGFFVGTVGNILLQDNQLSLNQYEAAVNGDHEPNTLTEVSVTLINPDAEAGDTSGWSNDEGGIEVVDWTSRDPFGSWFFNAGPHLKTVARQQVDLLSETGLTGAELDSLAAADDAWCVLKWQQKGYSSGGDNGGMGLRNVDGGGSEINTSYSAMIDTVPKYTRWIPRYHPLLIADSTRNMDVLMQSLREDGTNNDTYFDNIQVKVYHR